MQVEQYEINGFVIDKFNQYGLEVGKKQGVCPNSTICRQPKNHKKKCSSYDWERGLGTCHNCNKSFQLHTCLLYTSPSPRDLSTSRMPSSA